MTYHDDMCLMLWIQHVCLLNMSYIVVGKVRILWVDVWLVGGWTAFILEAHCVM